jgi:hypothetical protein
VERNIAGFPLPSIMNKGKILMLLRRHKPKILGHALLIFAGP